MKDRTVQTACGLLQDLCDDPIDLADPVSTIDSLTVLEWVFVLEEAFETPVDESVVEGIDRTMTIQRVAELLLS